MTASTDIREAFTSMLRADYISLNDDGKLNLLADYYVDYFGYLNQILGENDQLIVGRRGTGKTTLLYRALVECMRSWGNFESCQTKPRTLGIYIDLSKCQNLESTVDFSQFEHAFVSEMCDSIIDQMGKFWPGLEKEPNIFAKLFKAAELKQTRSIKFILERLTKLLQTGIPRIIEQATPVQTKESQKSSTSHASGIQSSLGTSGPGIQSNLASSFEDASEIDREFSTQSTYRLMISDVFRLLRLLKDEAKLSAIFIFVDEFSDLSESLQRRLSTLLRKMLGTHSGVFLKICAITDSYTLGSSIILQRDLFEISLDLDAYVDRSGTLNDAMDGLKEQAERIVTSRLKAYNCPNPAELFDDPDDTWIKLSRSAMGVPRTLGIVLQQSWGKAFQMYSTRGKKIRKSDITYGIQYASRAYLNQMLGAAKGNVAIRQMTLEIWSVLIDRAQKERAKIKENEGASHFMLLPKHEQMLKYLNMFFLVHLLSTGRTTKKEKLSRSLYCFDYGICDEYNLGFATDKNILRQQRFAYDDELIQFEPYFGSNAEPIYTCPIPDCELRLKENDLNIGGVRLCFCPIHRVDLVKQDQLVESQNYTEEEIKIIGAIRSSKREDHIFARQVADDVGCHVQKVAKFGEKLEKDKLATRAKEPADDKFIYFGTEEL